jgi:acid phosphatase class B
MNVSFDFDGTLHRDGHPLWPSLALLRWHDQCGHRVIIVTTRTQAHEDAEWWSVHEPDRVIINEFLSRYRLTVRGVLFTEHQPKANSLVRHGIELHYDDDPQEVTAAQAAGVQSVLLNGVSFHV